MSPKTCAYDVIDEWAQQQHIDGKKVGAIKNGKSVSEVILPFITNK